MAVSSFVYGLFLKSLCSGRIDFGGHNFKAMLVTQTYSPNQDAHQFKSSVTGECTGSGYVAGGIPVTISSFDYQGSSNRLTVLAGNLLWPVITVSARYIVIYDDTPATVVTKPLVACVDFGEVKTPAGQSFYYNWPSGKLLDLAVA